MGIQPPVVSLPVLSEAEGSNYWKLYCIETPLFSTHWKKSKKLGNAGSKVWKNPGETFPPLENRNFFASKRE